MYTILPDKTELLRQTHTLGRPGSGSMFSQPPNALSIHAQGENADIMCPKRCSKRRSSTRYARQVSISAAVAIRSGTLRHNATPHWYALIFHGLPYEAVWRPGQCGTCPSSAFLSGRWRACEVPCDLHVCSIPLPYRDSPTVRWCRVSPSPKLCGPRSGTQPIVSL